MRRSTRFAGTKDLLSGSGFTARQATALLLGVLMAVVLSPAGARGGTGQTDSRPSGPFLTFGPSTNGTYDYGKVEVGQTASQVFTLTNSGSKSTSALSLTSVGSGAFVLSGDACSQTNLRPGMSCTFEVGYTSTVVGVTDTGTVTATGHKPLVSAALNLIVVSPRHIYWSDGSGLIGRADVFGTHEDHFFITGLDSPCCLAVDSNHIYWGVLDADAPAIGRANLDGTNPDPNFITGLAHAPSGVAVDSGHIYWTEYLSGTIGRANLDGTNPDGNFITGLSSPLGVAVDSSYIYWGEGFAPATIGRANLDGTNPDQTFITGLFKPEGVAVDSYHVYWAEVPLTGGAIGRADLDGTNVKLSFITGLPDPQGVAVDSSHIYWGDYFLYAIGRADLDGTNVEQGLISGVAPPVDMAVDSG